MPEVYRYRKITMSCKKGTLSESKSSRLMTKPSKWLCAQRRLRSAWASAQSDQRLRYPHEESLGPLLPIERTAKTLIRLGRCPGWSESSLGAQSFLCPATRKWRGIMLYPPKFWVSVRPSVCLSVCLSVRPSVRQRPPPFLYRQLLLQF